MKRRALVRVLNKVFVSLCGQASYKDIIDIIISKVDMGPGESKYAKERRAKSIGRCPRCYRVKPGFYYTTRCNGVTCVPAISYNVAVKEYITMGVTSVKPSV